MILSFFSAIVWLSLASTWSIVSLCLKVCLSTGLSVSLEIMVLTTDYSLSSTCRATIDLIDSK